MNVSQGINLGRGVIVCDFYEHGITACNLFSFLISPIQQLLIWFIFSGTLAISVPTIIIGLIHYFSSRQSS